MNKHKKRTKKQTKKFAYPETVYVECEGEQAVMPPHAVHDIEDINNCCDDGDTIGVYKFFGTGRVKLKCVEVILDEE